MASLSKIAVSEFESEMAQLVFAIFLYLSVIQVGKAQQGS